VILGLVEAAVRTGRTEEAALHVAALHQENVRSLSSRLALVVGGAAAMATASTEEAVGLFDQALAVTDADRWPFDRARVELVYGERFRRASETAAARAQLAASLDAFERLGAHPWAQRAANELRATGITIGRPEVAGPEAPSPQQLEIARLAAAGLSNKEIGERLFL
jgi:ATP/maltotriose-dependent transcriptional regulator MalT